MDAFVYELPPMRAVFGAGSSEMRQPIRRVDRVRDIDAEVRHWHKPRLGRPVARANYRVAERHKPRRNCRPDQPGDADDQHAHCFTHEVSYPTLGLRRSEGRVPRSL